MSYTQIEEDERLERWRERNVRRVALLAVFTFSVVGAYMFGQHQQLSLATRAYNNAESAARMLWVCTESATRTMSVVLAEDASLHEKLRELPPIVWVQP